MASYFTDEYGLSVDSNGDVPGGLKKDALDTRAKVEAEIYSLLNPYLDQRQKALVEVWYQLPMGAFTYAYLIASFVSSDIAMRPVFVAIYASLFVGWLTTILANEKFLQFILPIDVVVTNSFLVFALIGIFAFTAIISWWSALGLAILSLTGLPNAGMQLADMWACTSYPTMNPKYAAAKKIFDIPEFAFEKYFSENHIHESKLSKKGKKGMSLISLALLIGATFLWA
jgi:hypothetical protein